MSAYVRIELHQTGPYDKPDSSDYADLHALLAERSIERKVSITGVGEQCLPTGFYYTTASDKQEIAKDVNWAAKQVGYPYSFVIVINAGALVKNLDLCTCD